MLRKAGLYDEQRIDNDNRCNYNSNLGIASRYRFDILLPVHPITCGNLGRIYKSARGLVEKQEVNIKIRLKWPEIEDIGHSKAQNMIK